MGKMPLWSSGKDAPFRGGRGPGSIPGGGIFFVSEVFSFSGGPFFFFSVVLGRFP